MGASSEVFIKMREEEFNEIPNEIKERYLNSKNISKQTNDFDLNMQDENYQKFYKKYKSAKKELEEHEYYLREKRRKDALQSR